MAEDTTKSTLFGVTASLVEAYPELQKVYDLWAAGNLTDAELAYYETDYYKTLSTTARDRVNKKATQPEVYAQEFEAYALQQKEKLFAEGLRIDDDTFNFLIEEAFDKGLTYEQLKLRAAAAYPSTAGGTTLGNVQNLKEYADSFGMSYSQNVLNQWSDGIFSGMETIYDIQDRIRQDAASAFPIYADQINKGVSIEALASAYKTSMGNILEIDPDSISYDDPTLRKALQYVDSNGKPAVKPLWQFETELRMDPRWEKTDNARATVDSLSLKVLRDFGLA